MEKVHPDNFKFHLGGFSRTSWQVSWEAGKLYWRKFAAEWQEVASEEIQPSDEEWLAFWNALDESRIWSWDEAYYSQASRAGEDLPDNASIEELAELSDDILSWGVEILLKDGRYIDSSGSNAVPGRTAKARSSRNRRRRGGRPQRNRKPSAEAESAAPAIMLADSNAGIPEDTFDLFLGALRILIRGKEFGDDEVIPQAVETAFRGRTEKRRSRKSPIDLLEAETTEKAKPRKKRRTLRRRDGKTPNQSETKTTRKRSRRRKKPAKDGTGEGAAGAESKSGSMVTRKKRRRRRRTPKSSGEASATATAGKEPAQRGEKARVRESGKPGKRSRSKNSRGPTQETGSSGSNANSGDAPAKKKRRRRRRLRSRGDNDGGNAGGAPPATGD